MRFKREDAKRAEDLERAILKIRHGSSLRAAARECGVKRSTLQHRLKRGFPAHSKECTLLSKNKESQLVNFVKYMADAGQPISTLRVRQLARSLLNER